MVTDMATNRTLERENSNNQMDANKNICALRVAEYLNVEKTVRYLHTITDLVRAARKSYTVRSRMSKVKGKSVGAARKALSTISEKENSAHPIGGKVAGYIIRVKGHAVFVDSNGNTVIDTDPRKADRRKITHCYMVMDDFIKTRGYALYGRRSDFYDVRTVVENAIREMKNQNIGTM